MILLIVLYSDALITRNSRLYKLRGEGSIVVIKTQFKWSTYFVYVLEIGFPSTLAHELFITRITEFVLIRSKLY